MQTLHHFWAPKMRKCKHYTDFGFPRWENANTTPLWDSQHEKMQTLHKIGSLFFSTFERGAWGQYSTFLVIAHWMGAPLWQDQQPAPLWGLHGVWRWLKEINILRYISCDSACDVPQHAVLNRGYPIWSDPGTSHIKPIAAFEEYAICLGLQTMSGMQVGWALTCSAWHSLEYENYEVRWIRVWVKNVSQGHDESNGWIVGTKSDKGNKTASSIAPENLSESKLSRSQKIDTTRSQTKVNTMHYLCTW